MTAETVPGTAVVAITCEDVVALCALSTAVVVMATAVVILPAAAFVDGDESVCKCC